MRAPLLISLFIFVLFSQGLSARGRVFKQILCPAEINIDKELHVKPLYRQDTLKLLVVGDLMLHYPQIIRAKKDDGSFDFSNYFKLVHHYFDEADLTIGNFESTVCGAPYSGYPKFSAPEDFVIQLLDDGFDILLCANNHVLDYGSKGASFELNLFNQLKSKYDFSYTGLVEKSQESHLTLFVVRKGIRIAIVNFTYPTNEKPDAAYPKVNLLYDIDSLKRALSISQVADLVIAMPHWGDEYELVHNAAQRKMAEFMIKNGADVIIGTHPHVVQDRELINEKPVYYSIGNFVSNMSAKNTQLGLMISLCIIREHNGEIKICEPDLIWTWCSKPGGYCDDYAVIPIERYRGKESEWKGRWDYNKMITTYHSIVNSYH